MRVFLLIIVIVIVALIVGVFVFQKQTERYQVIYSTFLTLTNKEAIPKQAAICFSDKELKEAVQPSVLQAAGLKSLDLNQPDLILCVLLNYNVEMAVGRGNLGFIGVRRSATNGVSFTVLKGTKRMLQLNYLD